MHLLISDPDQSYARNLAHKLQSLRSSLIISIYGAEMHSQPPDLILLGSSEDPLPNRLDIPRLSLNGSQPLQLQQALLQEENPYYGDKLQRYSLPERIVEAIDRWSRNHPATWDQKLQYRCLYLPSSLPSWDVLSPFFSEEDTPLVVPIAPSYLFPFLADRGEQRGLSDWLELQVSHLQADWSEYLQETDSLQYLPPLRFGSDLEVLQETQMQSLLQTLSDSLSLQERSCFPLFLCGGMPPAFFAPLWKDACEIRFFCPPSLPLHVLEQELQLACQAVQSRVTPLPFFGAPVHESG